MADEGSETFQVSPTRQPERRAMVADKRCLHITIIDHNPVIEGTGDVSHLDIKIPLPLVEACLQMIPTGKLGNVDPAVIVQMIDMGADGEIIRIDEEKKSINIRIE